MIIKNDMKFNDQVTSAAKRINKTLGMIKRNFKCINKDALEVFMVRCERTFQICCASMVTISNWFEKKIRAVTKENNQIG